MRPAATGWRVWAWAYLAAWAVPPAIGALLVAVYLPVAAVLPGDRAEGLLLGLYMGATALLISPAFSWIGLLLSVLPMLALAAAGWLGWVPALACGALSGWAAAALLGGIDSLTGPLYGLAAAAILRGTLQRLHPSMF